MKQQDNEKCCGSCCWFKHEVTDGQGWCYKIPYKKRWDFMENIRYCSDDACDNYTSNDEMRHHLTVLICHNRWRRDDHVPNSHKMQDPKEIGKAIDFAVDYIKTFMEL